MARNHIDEGHKRWLTITEERKHQMFKPGLASKLKFPPDLTAGGFELQKKVISAFEHFPCCKV